MRIAICDDNEIQIGIFMHRINNFLKRNGDIKALITPYDKGQPLIDDVADGEWYDIVVLDIVLKEENGIEGHQVTHAVVINKNFEIVFDPNREYKNIKEYPASDKLGYNGIKNIYLFTPKVV